MNRAKKIFLGVLFSCVLVLCTLLNVVLGSRPALAASCSSFDTCITVTLQGTVPAGNIAVVANRATNISGGPNTYPLKPQGNNVYFVSSIDPWTSQSYINDKGTTGNCGNTASQPLKNFNISVTNNNNPIAAPQGIALNCHTNNNLSINVSTTPVALGTFTDTILVDGQPAQTFAPSSGGAAVLTLSGGPGGTIQQTSFKNGIVVFNNIQPGTYELKGQVLNPNTTQNLTPIATNIDHTGIVINAGDNTGTENITAANGNPAQAPTDNGTGQTPSCESAGSPVGWILCAIYNDTAKFVDFLLHNLVEPLLKTDPISTDPANSTYQIWSNFRIYGNIFLVIALLVVVFGEIIGGGLIEAYTVRKMLPRILIAVILINLSVYIVALMVDITNILGAGIGQLLTAPLGTAAQFKFALTGGQQAGIVSLGAIIPIGAYLGGILALKAAAGGTTLLSLAGSAVPALLLFIVMPAVLSLLAVIFTILIRKAAILFLILVSPVAFALYCLPNTEKYFRKWLDLLFTTLLVYPIIMVFFAISDILSVTIMNANHTGSGSVLSAVPRIVNGDFLAPLVAFVALFLPLILIPYSFRLAGGAVGKIHETLTNYHKKGQEAIKGNVNDPNSFRNKARLGLKNAYNARASDVLNNLRESTKEGGRNANGFSRRAAVARMRAINIGDLDKKRKDQNELFDKEISGKVAMGSDFLERAFFARQWADPDRTYTDAHGNTQTLKQGRYYSIYKNSDGIYDEKSEGDVKAAHGRYDGNASKIQTLIKYETGKIASDNDFYGVDAQGNTILDPSQINDRIDRTNSPMGSFMSNLPTVMEEAGLSPFSAGSASIGSFFATQTAHRELKHTRPDGKGGWTQDKHAFVQDYAENVGSYATSTGKSAPTRRLTSIYKELQTKQARLAANQPQKEKYKGQDGKTVEVDESWTPTDERSWNDLHGIAKTLDTRLGGGGYGVSTVTDEGPVPSGGGRSSGAPGRVNEAIEEFVQTVLPNPSGGGPRNGGGGGRPGTPPPSEPYGDQRGYP